MRTELSPFAATAVVALLLMPSTARADLLDVEEPTDPLFSDLELALDIGVSDRGTTGTGDLRGYGYDHGGGPVAGVGARLYFAADNRYFRHGLSVRLSHQAAGDFGLGGDFGFASTELSLAYAFRTLLPCMSSDELAFHLTGFLGLTGVRADAGTGRGERDAMWNRREAAADELDHLGLGGILGVSLDLHRGPVLVGVALDVREHFSLGDGPVSRDFATSAVLRWGLNLSL